MHSLARMAHEVTKVHLAFGDFTRANVAALLQVNKLLALSFQKTGGTFIYCTWSARTGPHAVTKCTYKTRIIRGGPKKMRHHFAKEHFVEL